MNAKVTDVDILKIRDALQDFHRAGCPEESYTASDDVNGLLSWMQDFFTTTDYAILGIRILDGYLARNSPEPIPMLIFCPVCSLQHIDKPDPPLWTNPPHRSHKCEHCGHIFRQCDVPTTGIKGIATKGKCDGVAYNLKAQKCEANMYADPPRDCNWPHCGCDPNSTEAVRIGAKDMQHLLESNDAFLESIRAFGYLDGIKNRKSSGSLEYAWAPKWAEAYGHGYDEGQKARSTAKASIGEV